MMYRPLAALCLGLALGVATLLLAAPYALALLATAPFPAARRRLRAAILRAIRLARIYRREVERREAARLLYALTADF